MEEKEIYQDIERKLAMFSETNYQFSTIPYKIGTNKLIIPINKVNFVSGIGETYLPQNIKNNELTFKIIDENNPSALGLYGASIKPIAVLYIDNKDVKLIKIEEDNVYNDIFSLLKTIVKNMFKKK